MIWVKNGYVKTDSNDTEWYSISSKVFPIVVEKYNPDRNGIIDLKESGEIYVWVPFYTIKDGEYRFCNADGNIIQYQKNPNDVFEYTLGDKSSSFKGGKWVLVNSDLKPFNPRDGKEYDDEDYKAVTENIFTWE